MWTEFLFRNVVLHSRLWLCNLFIFSNLNRLGSTVTPTTAANMLAKGRSGVCVNVPNRPLLSRKFNSRRSSCPWIVYRSTNSSQVQQSVLQVDEHSCVQSYSLHDQFISDNSSDRHTSTFRARQHKIDAFSYAT